MSNISEVQLIRLLDRQAKKECCNYYSGYCCAKDMRCGWRKADEEFSERGITCKWFREAVLPANKELETVYEEWKSTENAKREAEYRGVPLSEVLVSTNETSRCENCLKPIVFQSNSHKYCDGCATLINRQKNAARVRRHRLKTEGNNVMK